MQTIGYEVIDSLVAHFEQVRNKKIKGDIDDPVYFDKVLGGAIPTKGENPMQLITQLKEVVFENVVRVDHPRFYSFIPSPSNFMGVMADTLAIGFNVFNGHWMSGGAASAVERITIDWLKEICDFPKTGGGLFVSGGSMANLSAIATARKVILGAEDVKGVIYYSHQTHSSLSKGLKILGIGKAYRRPLPTTQDLKIDILALKKAIKKDIKAGLTPFCIVGNAGTTNAGVVDPLEEMSAIAKKYNCWFHIDGAYGAAAMLCKKGRKVMKGIGKADSLTLDPHKWWFQPMEMGCLLVRDPKDLEATYAVSAEYLLDTKSDALAKINYYDYGVQLTRYFRALKLYLSIRTFGIDAFRKAVKVGIRMAEYTEELLAAKKDWRIITAAQLGVINFAYAPKGTSTDDIKNYSKKISEKVIADGYSMIITTVIHGETVLRMCPIHPGLRKKDIEKTVELLDAFAKELRINK